MSDDVDELRDGLILLREQYDEPPGYCSRCELPVTLSADSSDVQPMRFGCGCRTISPGVQMPKTWEDTP